LTKIFYYVFYEAKQYIFCTEIPLSCELHCSYEKCPYTFLKGKWHDPHQLPAEAALTREPRTALLLHNTLTTTVLSEIYTRCPLPSSSAARQHLSIHPQLHRQFLLSIEFLKF
jgi:hypothetical protein